MLICGFSQAPFFRNTENRKFRANRHSGSRKAARGSPSRSNAKRLDAAPQPFPEKRTASRSAACAYARDITRAHAPARGTADRPGLFQQQTPPEPRSQATEPDARTSTAKSDRHRTIHAAAPDARLRAAKPNRPRRAKAAGDALRRAPRAATEPRAQARRNSSRALPTVARLKPAHGLRRPMEQTSTRPRYRRRRTALDGPARAAQGRPGGADSRRSAPQRPESPQPTKGAPTAKRSVRTRNRTASMLLNGAASPCKSLRATGRGGKRPRTGKPPPPSRQSRKNAIRRKENYATAPTAPARQSVNRDAGLIGTCGLKASAPNAHERADRSPPAKRQKPPRDHAPSTS